MRRLLVCIAAVVVFPYAALSQPYLSNLNLHGGPIYTYYAAPPHRADLLLDQAYKFVFQRRERGLQFETDRGEILGLAFKINDAVRYFSDELAVHPTITHSYSDILRFSFEPFHGVEITATFAAYRSAVTILELDIANETGVPIEFDLYPFLYLEDGMSNVQLGSETITFSHPQARPSASFGLPHADTLYDFFRLDEPAQAAGAYAALGPYKDRPTGFSTASTGQDSARDHPTENLQGQIYLQDGSLCTSESAAMDVHYDGSMLTDTAPQNMLPGDGSYSVPETYLPEDDSVLVRVVCEGEQGEVAVPTDEPAVDIQLSPDSYVPPPHSVEANTTTDYRTVFLLWEGAGGFDVYRAPPTEPWRFERIAESLAAASHFDNDVEPDSAYRYTVVAIDSLGRESGRSAVVRKDVPPPPPEPTPSFFDETQLDTLSGEVQIGPLHVAAFQRTLEMEPGETRTVRLIREISDDPAHDPSFELGPNDLDAVIAEAEAAFDGVPDEVLRPLVYWSAMNLVRQSVVRHQDGTYLVDRRGASDPRRSLLQEPSSLFAMPLVAEFDEDLARDILLTTAAAESGGFIPYWTGPYVTGTADAMPAFPPILARAAQWTGIDPGELRPVYDAAASVYEHWSASDADSDGLAEWRHALESMRPTSVIWERHDPANVEALDLNIFLAREARVLARVARDSAEAARWRAEFNERANLIRETFWDEESEFFYHAERSTNEITDELKRREIIGFMPGYGVASTDQKSALAEHYADPNTFKRRYGLPSLSAADPAYRGAGSWDGPVHPAWQWYVALGAEHYQVDEGLKDAIETSLARSHDFYELYSPDHEWAGHAPGEVENGWIALTLRIPTVGTESTTDSTPTSVKRYPNPFRDEVKISYALQAPEHVRIALHDALGRRVVLLVDEKQAAGRHSTTWRPQDVAPGVYFYRLERGDNVTSGSAIYLGGQ